jgi:hypothetical protein
MKDNDRKKKKGGEWRMERDRPVGNTRGAGEVSETPEETKQRNR